MPQEVLLGFSGGIDSAASVDILRKMGYSPRGLYIDILGDKAQREITEQRAKQLSLPLIIEDKSEFFQKEIIDYFYQSYLKALTPAPCTVCNTKIKWASLSEVSKRVGIEKIATGHYFGVEKIKEKYYVINGVDSIKNQSYYLWNIPQSVLSRVICPMRDALKSDVMHRESSRGMRESMGVCFLRGVNYTQQLKERYGSVIKKGKIIDTLGREVGEHEGFPFYTIGQKRGLDIKDKTKKYCIIGIDATTNTLTVGEDKDLNYYHLVLKDINVVDMDELLQCADTKVIIRGLGRNPGGSAKIDLVGDRLHITLSEPAWAPALGQPSVIYSQNRVLGGGILEKYY
ncbi:MAG: tRNA-specific 2-thiouridylase [Rikenellaceae bacterium]